MNTVHLTTDTTVRFPDPHIEERGLGRMTTPWVLSEITRGTHELIATIPPLSSN